METSGGMAGRSGQGADSCAPKRELMKSRAASPVRMAGSSGRTDSCASLVFGVARSELNEARAWVSEGLTVVNQASSGSSTAGARGKNGEGAAIGEEVDACVNAGEAAKNPALSDDEPVSTLSALGAMYPEMGAMCGIKIGVGRRPRKEAPG